MPVIDQYSVASVPIEMFFGATLLSQGTAFFWQKEQQLFLVTNWHNVSGRRVGALEAAKTSATLFRADSHHPRGAWDHPGPTPRVVFPSIPFTASPS